MRATVLGVLLVLLLLTGAYLVWGRTDRDAEPVVATGMTERQQDDVAATGSDALAPLVPSRIEAARLAGTTARRAPSESPAEPVSPFTPPPLFSGPELVAGMLRDGTRIERIWGEYVRASASPTMRRWIDEALRRNEPSPLDAPWMSPATTLPARVALHLRLLRAAPGFWRDLGVDIRGHSAYLDDTELEIIELVLSRRLDDLRLEDELRLTIPTGVIEDHFLRATDAWPKLPDGRTLPLGAVVRVHFVVSEDKRFVTLQVRAHSATAVLSGGDDEAAKGISVRALPTSSFVMPDGGTVLLLLPDSLLGSGIPPGEPAEPAKTATRDLLMLHVTLE